MNLVFGYGSLLSAESVSRTLNRKIEQNQLTPCSIEGYRRTWTAGVDVYINGNKDKTAKARFLDLSTSIGTICNGVAISLTDRELSSMDVRERQYQRVEVKALIKDALFDAFLYIIPEKQKSLEGQVLAKYYNLVKDAVEKFPEPFQDQFWKSTDPCGSFLEGNYSFVDSQQNKAAGR